MRCIQQPRCKYTKHNQIHKRCKYTNALQKRKHANQKRCSRYINALQKRKHANRSSQRKFFRPLGGALSGTARFSAPRGERERAHIEVWSLKNCKRGGLHVKMYANLSFSVDSLLRCWAKPITIWFKLLICALSLRGAENKAVPLSAPPRGLENFRCENSMQRFSLACFRFGNAFVYLQRVYVFAARLLNAAYELSN